MSAVVADTHAVLWMLLDSPRLSTGARSALQDAVQSGSSIYMAAISLVEIVYLVDKSRLPINALQKLQAALNNPAFGLEVIPLDRDIAEAVAQIPLAMVPLSHPLIFTHNRTLLRRCGVRGALRRSVA